MPYFPVPVVYVSFKTPPHFRLLPIFLRHGGTADAVVSLCSCEIRLDSLFHPPNHQSLEPADFPCSAQ